MYCLTNNKGENNQPAVDNYCVLIRFKWVKEAEYEAYKTKNKTKLLRFWYKWGYFGI